MFRTFVCAAVALLMVGGSVMAQQQRQRGQRPQAGQVVKMEGDKVTVSIGRGDNAMEKTFTLTSDTKYLSREGQGAPKELKADEAKDKMKKGTRVAIVAGEDGKVKTLTFGGGRRRQTDR